MGAARQLQACRRSSGGEECADIAQAFEGRLGVAAGDVGQKARRDQHAGAATRGPAPAQLLIAVLQADIDVAAGMPTVHVGPVAIDECADDKAASPPAAELIVAAALRGGEPAAAA